MAVFHGQTVDVYEDFEDALGGDWSEEDTGSILTPVSADAEYVGTYGMKVDLNIGDYAAYVYNLFSSKTTVSIGFWFHSFAGTYNFTYPIAGFQGYMDIRWLNDTGTWYFRAVDVDNSSYSSSKSTDTWYWITMQFVQNWTGTVKIYDTSHNLLDTLTCTCSNDTVVFVIFGLLNSKYEAANIYFDEVVIDYADATFPLLGWDADGGLTWTTYTHKTMVFA
jgi:hypothetical protein